jgi:hypothetical protein
MFDFRKLQLLLKCLNVFSESTEFAVGQHKLSGGMCPSKRKNMCQSVMTHTFLGRTAQRSLLGFYATSREVAGSIPDEVIGFFNRPNRYSRTMALG